MPDLEVLNTLPDDQARDEFLRCCGSTRWARLMADGRPYRNREQLTGAADRVWFNLKPGDWLEAFSHHPRIGDKEALRAKFAATREWAAGEQAGALGASEEVLDALAEGNKAYEAKFGYIFIVCATGKSAGEMLALLQERLHNDREAELVVAAREQARITRIRLEKLLET